MPFYTDSQREMQDAFESRALADAIETAIVTEGIDETQKAFIEAQDFFFLSTVNDRGEPTVSYKGGGVGTVKVLDNKTIVFPAYDGNGMFLSVGNIADTAKIGLLFIDFETPNRLRVQAHAKLLDNDELKGEYPGAIAVVQATVDRVFVNCARYIHPHQRVESSRYVPNASGQQPHATWKRIDRLQGALSEDDRNRTKESGGTISEEQYGEALSRGTS